MSHPHRPARGETDEDLLRLQQEFLAKKEKPAVNVIKKVNPVPLAGGKDGPNNPTQQPSSKSTPSFEAASSSETARSSSAGQEPRNVPREIPLPTPKWMTEQTAPNDTPEVPLKAKSQGNDSGPPKRKSLFALRMEKSRADAKSNTEPTTYEKSVPKNKTAFGDRSYVISGKQGEEIHHQNVSLLEKLSVQEIEEERQRLMSQLSSSSISYLLSRRKVHGNQDTSKDLKNPTVQENLISERAVSKKVEHSEVSNEKKRAFSNSLTSPEKHEEQKPNEKNLLDTLPINPNEAKQWLHMDVVEKDKLEWMKELPPVRKDPGPEEPYAARFDFQGLLLPYNDDKVEVNEGLHHHGDEPERPGYTLQELMQLSRSSVQQQRIMGLNTLGNVLIKSKLGIYDSVLQQNIVKELLDAGIFLLLRFSMDDLSPPVVIAALTAMRNLLFNEPDEASLDYILGCEGGLQNPLLEVPYEENDAQKIQEQKDHEAELKDFEIIQLDVLKGAERTNLIARLGYILDVLKGPPDIVLDVLLRIARHSRNLAEAIVKCGGLLRTIRDQLLTTQVIPSLAAGFGQPGYGEPSSKALKLMRVLAAHSRTIANTLLDKFNIMEPVMTYVSMSSPELPHIQSLVIHGFYLWQTFMSYGLASQSVIDLFPILMRQLHFHAQLTSAVGEEAASSGHELATALIGIIERASDIVMSDHNILDCKPVFQLAKLVIDCARKWMTQQSQSTDIPSWSCVKLIGSALNCIATVGSCAKKQDGADARSILERVEAFAHETIFPFLKSSSLQRLIDNLIPSSYFLSSGEPGTKRDPPNLPSIGALEWCGQSLLPGLLPNAPQPLLSGLLRFIAASCEILGSSSVKFQSLLLDNAAIDNYIRALVSETLCSSSQWFCRQEVYMLHHLVVLIVLQPKLVPSQYQARYSQLAFRVVDLIQANDKYLISGLLPITIFSPEFVRWGMDPNRVGGKFQELIDESLIRLPSTGSLYLNMLGVRFSKAPPPSQRTSLTSLPKGTDPALPVDWHFAPILILYGQYNAQNRARCSEHETILMVTDTLQFLFLVENLWPKARRPLSVTARWCRLALVFLAGSDLFLDKVIQRYLKINLEQLLLQRSKLNFNEAIPGLSSFYDLYGELLLQFSAVSYGDKLFGAFLLLPLQQRQDPQLRRMVWGENSVVIRALATAIDEVGVPIEEYLEPCETDPILLTHYLESVARGQIIEKTCPVLFRVAVHHVATFVARHKDHTFARSLQKRIEHLGNKNIRELFLNYKNPTEKH